MHRTTALRLVAQRAREVAGADQVLILLADEDVETLTVEVADPDDTVVGAVLTVAGTAIAEAVVAGRHVVVDDLGTAAVWPVALHTGAALLIPLAAAGTVLGILAVANAPGGSAFDTAADVTLVKAFADQAALAMERARGQEERELLVVLEDRERIARDLHDVVIQRLFATGLQLQSAARLAARPEVGTRINGAVDDLDTTIRDIRSAIFELRAPVSAELRGSIRSTVDSAAASLGFRPELRLDGPLDSAVPDSVQPELLAVLREALSNVVKHARATAVVVAIEAVGGQLTLTVVDDGVGGVHDERGGLANLRQRAERLGGQFAVTSTPAGGTTVRWSVPT